MKRAILLVGLTGCGGSTWYDTEVDILHTVVVQRGPDGSALDLDVQLEYPLCPGHQVELIRGDAAFAACMAQYPVGTRLAARIEYYLTERNHHDWDIHRLGACDRTPDPDDEASFDKVEECAPILVNGVEEGFSCNHIPQGELLAACPWFQRH